MCIRSLWPWQDISHAIGAGLSFFTSLVFSSPNGLSTRTLYKSTSLPTNSGDLALSSLRRSYPPTTPPHNLSSSLVRALMPSMVVLLRPPIDAFSFKCILPSHYHTPERCSLLSVLVRQIFSVPLSIIIRWRHNNK